MGDIADLFLDRIDWSIYNGYDDGDGWEQPVRYKTCRCCKSTGLYWRKYDEKWRLCDDRGIHKCKVNSLLF